MARLIRLFIAISLVAGCSSPPVEKSNGDAPVIIVNNGSANNGEGTNNGGPIITECGPGRQLCDGACVDVSVDAERCGSCSGPACSDTQVCSDGACVEVPTDCRSEGECPARYYCDENTGKCAVGCKSNADCPGSGYCELASHTCLCTEPGQVVCGGECVAESPLTCGATCETCPGVANGEAVCEEGACGLACADGYMLCDGKCSACPSGAAVLGLACLGDQCVASECAAGHEICDGECAACPQTSGTESLGCDGNQCIITDCPAGTKLCGGTCADCPDDPSGTTQCSGNQCVLVCSGGYHSCGDYCALDDDTSACGPNCQFCDGDPNGFAVCENNACGLSCDTGFKACGGACAECPAGPGIAATTCAGSTCVVQSCSAGYTPCSFGCCQPAPDAEINAWGHFLSGVSIALDSRGYPHIAYAGATPNEVRYAYWAGNQWVDEYVGGGWDVSLALDSQDRPHVAIWNRNGGSADYGFRGTNGWTIEKVEQFDVGMTPDILLDGNTIHIAYYDQTREDLRYATRTGTMGTWTKQTIDSAGKRGFSPSIALSGGLVGFAYHDGTDQSLRYASLFGSVSTEEVDSEGNFDFGINSSLVFDGNGDAHVAYQGNIFASSAEGVYYAYRDPNGIWTSVRTIEDAVNPVLFINANGAYSIVYQNRPDGDVKLRPFVGSDVDLYTTGYVGEELDATLDSAGTYHVAFSDGTNKSVRYLSY